MVVMGAPHTDAVAEHLAAAHAALEKVHLAHPEDTVRHLSVARACMDAALNEAMAQATLAGSSIRAVAEMAGVVPNTLGPRLARTATLGGYGETDGRITATGVARARYDHQEGRYQPSAPAEPLRFRRRESRGK